MRSCSSWRDGTDTKLPAVILEHVDASPTIRGIHHQVHRTLRFQDRGQRTQARIGIGQMMQDTSGHNQVERALQFTDALDRQLPEVQVRQPVLQFELVRVLDARRADVDADDESVWPAQRVPRGLPRSAAGNEDVEIGAIRCSRPEEVMLGAMTIGIAPLVARAIEVVDGRRIGVAGVELGDRVRGHAR